MEGGFFISNIMLTYQNFHKEVNYYKSLTGKEPDRVRVHHKQGDQYTLKLISANDFHLYQFIGYNNTYTGSFYPVVVSIENKSK